MTPSNTSTSPDPSVLAWETLRCEKEVSARHNAFEALLELNRGWWGNGTLLMFSRSSALFATRRVLVPFGYSVDQLDWEAVGDEALLVLYERAMSVQCQPRAWLRGVIHNLVHESVRRNWNHLSASPVVEELAVSNAEGYETNRIQIDVDVFQSLDPSLRALIELVQLGYLTRPEMCAALDISPVALRKRFERMRRALEPRMVNDNSPIVRLHPNRQFGPAGYSYRNNLLRKRG